MEGINVLREYFLQAKDMIMMIPENTRFLGTLFISAIAFLSSANLAFNKLSKMNFSQLSKRTKKKWVKK